MGGDAGYVQVTRTTGEGPVLLVLPAESSDGVTSTGFEGWRPLKGEDRANYDWMHEMLYEVMVHTKAYASTEWRNAIPWAPPTMATIGPGENKTYGVRLRLAQDVEHVPRILHSRPHAFTAIHSPIHVTPKCSSSRFFASSRSIRAPSFPFYSPCVSKSAPPVACR